MFFLLLSYQDAGHLLDDNHQRTPTYEQVTDAPLPHDNHSQAAAGVPNHSTRSGQHRKNKKANSRSKSTVVREAKTNAPRTKHKSLAHTPAASRASKRGYNLTRNPRNSSRLHKRIPVRWQHKKQKQKIMQQHPPSPGARCLYTMPATTRNILFGKKYVGTSLGGLGLLTQIPRPLRPKHKAKHRLPTTDLRITRSMARGKQPPLCQTPASIDHMPLSVGHDQLETKKKKIPRWQSPPTTVLLSQQSVLFQHFATGRTHVWLSPFLLTPTTE